MIRGRGPIVAAAGLFALTAPACRPAQPCALSIEAPAGIVGFSAPIELHARITCAGEIVPGDIVWDDGTRGPRRQLITPAVEDRLRREERARVLPVSFAESQLVVSARARDLHATATVRLAHTHNGLATIPVGVPIYIDSGPGGAISRFVAERSGIVAFTSPDGRATLRLHAGRADDIQLDCGRPECHAPQQRAHAVTPHASALQRLLDRQPTAFDPACLACHVVGAPADVPGGFGDVAAQIKFAFDGQPLTWPQLPRPLHRLGNVGCLACHGPAAIPPPQDRGRIYGAGICAQCHDAPDRYQVVAQWRSCRMSALRPGTAATACRGCHTSQGFVARLRGVDLPADPAARTAEPVTCAACHDPHGPGSTAPRMVRVTDKDRGASALCAACHRSDLAASDEIRLAARLAPMAPQAELAPADCLRCHRPHIFRANPVTASAALLDLAPTHARLMAALPPRRGCNRAARGATDVTVVGDRLALVDARGQALGDCDGDGLWSADEDPLLDDELAAQLYWPWRFYLIVARDHTAGRHDPARARQFLARAEALTDQFMAGGQLRPSSIRLAASLRKRAQLAAHRTASGGAPPWAGRRVHPSSPAAAH